MVYTSRFFSSRTTSQGISSASAYNPDGLIL